MKGWFNLYFIDEFIIFIFNVFWDLNLFRKRFGRKWRYDWGKEVLIRYGDCDLEREEENMKLL